ncbi:MAG: hypothetical protein WC624_03705, partial [Candidatus Margulisiibacteriota bacterium]
MKNKHILLWVLFILALLMISADAKIETGAGISYGFINNFKMWTGQGTDVGNVLQVDYFVKPIESYKAALEIGFVADNNVLNSVSAPTYVETGAYLNIKNYFYLKKSGATATYVSLGTGLYGVDLWWKLNNHFYSQSTNIFADLSAGAGLDINMKNLVLNMD